MHIQNINFQTIEKQWKQLERQSDTASIFQSYDFHRIFMRHFLQDEVTILGVYEGEGLVGIAPFILKNSAYEFIVTQAVLGGELVADYGDILAKTGKEKEVWEAVFNWVKKDGKGMKLDYIRPFVRLWRDFGKVKEMDVAPYIDLPDSWDAYLNNLSRHNRHEVRRKLKKGEAAGFTFDPDAKLTSDVSLPRIFTLMRGSHEGKERFLKPEMEAFFADLLQAGLLQVAVLKEGDKIVAAALYFITDTEVLLYNSGFDVAYESLSIGLTVKVKLLQWAIDHGKKKFDFLRGSERYKYDLGGKNQMLYRFTM